MHGEAIGLPKNFTILDTDDQVRLMKQLIVASNIDEKRWPARLLAGIIDGWKNRALTPDRVPSSEASAFNNRGTELYEQYQERLRSLNATGWLNFRMRAMLVSFASYHLWLHWRPTGLHLARQFTDFEAGIHWSQMQMQSGTTGINTLRMYSPTKQAQDQDPEGLFIRRWVPELSKVPLPYLATPWKMDESVQRVAACKVGVDYPQPIVDDKAAMKAAKDRMYGLRQTQQSREEAGAVLARHGSRKSGLPPSAQRRKAAPKRKVEAPPSPSGQGDLFA